MGFYETYFKAKRETANIIKYYHENGVWETVLHWLMRIGILSMKIFFRKELFTFFELNLVDPASGHKVDTTLDVVCVSRKDVGKDYADGWQDRNMARKRLERGDVLIVAKDNGKIIFSYWLVFKKVHVPAINLYFDIPDTTAYSAYIYTTPEYREKRVASRAIPLALKYLKDIGYQKVFILIEPENEPSIRVNRKAGFKEYQTLFYMRFIMFINFYYLKDCASNKKKVFWSLRKTDQQIWKTFSKITPVS